MKKGKKRIVVLEKGGVAIAVPVGDIKDARGIARGASTVGLREERPERELAMERQIRRMRKGFAMGKILVGKRDEIYDR
ncbi:MAG: hypothetical protein V1676_05995 [Candidatus Diapherotrites archaeon]